MALQFLLNLLGTLAGTAVYQALIVLGLLAALGIVWTEWHKSRDVTLRPYVVALALIMGFRLLALFVAPLHIMPDSMLAHFSSPFLYGSELLSVSLLLWAFVIAQRWSKHTRLALQILLCCWGGLVLLAVIQWYLESAGPVALTYTQHSWQVPLWHASTAIVACTGAALLFKRRGTTTLAPYAFALLGLGALVSLGGSGWFGTPLASGEGIGRLLALIAYPLFAIDLYQSALRDLETYRKELQDLSQDALRQSQSLLFLIEATRSIGDALDLRGMLGRVVENVAMALSTDLAAIFVLHPDHPDVITLAAQYRILGIKRTGPAQQLPLSDYPMLASTLRPRQLTFNDDVDSVQLQPLFDLLGVKQPGPILLQPLTRQKRTLGVLVACNEHTHRAFTSEQQSLATTIAVQLAGAVENSQLYRDLEAKAAELATLLKVREAEVRRQEAILESMTEGILVTDPRGQIILMNQAAEGILAVDRAEVLGEMVLGLLNPLLTDSPIESEHLLNLEDPVETVLTLQDRKILTHAAPVRMKDGFRLGVVAVMQDITREMLAEEAKRDFITSISHELRTPLTAIKGYVELLLTGMLGDLPSTMRQFLGVIRENTVRMNFITDNLISVSEIERGRLGLSYQTVTISKVVDDVLLRYREHFAEREIDVQLEMPEGLPTLEADPNRLRSVFDNLFSNALKFTYPGGQLRIGCAVMDDDLAEPTYLSCWVADTGVGVDLAEQGRIWERFYRADNPLSLEAGGLGIGLAIVKALAEAHGGRVWLDSTPGVGSKFTVLLPLHRVQGLEGVGLTR